MRHLLLAFALLAGGTVPAMAYTGPQLKPITANSKSPKFVKLKELYARLVEAMDAAPTAAQIQDPKAVQAAVDKMSAAFAYVDKNLTLDLNPAGSPAYGYMLDNLKVVESRVKFAKHVLEVSKAFHALADVAEQHGDPDDALLEAAKHAIDVISSDKDTDPEVYAAAAEWERKIAAKLHEVVLPADAPTMELSRKTLATAPIPLHLQVAGKRWKAVAIVNVTAPLHDLRLYGQGTALRLRGPAESHDGVFVAPKDAVDWSSIDPGTYLLEAQGRGEPVTIDSILTGPDTPLDPFLQVGTVPENLPVQNRTIEAFYPFSTGVDSAWERQKMFMTAPRALFVYARDDMDKHDVTPYTGDPNTLPAKDEPLLITSGPDHHHFLVFDAEGFAWELRDSKMLVGAPSGAPALPEKIHPLQMEFDPTRWDANGPTGFQAFAPGAPVDKLLKSFRKTVDTWMACTGKVIAKYGGGDANNYDVVTYQNGHVAKVEGLSDVAWREADAKCGTKAYEKKLQAFSKQLSDAHNKMRAAALVEIRAAWSK